MLLELKVTNFAIIENLHIQFQDGLNILSGETGAGKSVLLKSLSLLMGTKGSSESIRSGANQASIEGSFDLSSRPDVKKTLEDHGIEVDDDQLIVRRVLAEDKSRVYLNGVLSTLNNLRDVVAPLIELAGDSAPLIEMTGQHESRHLLSKGYHLDLLDQYSGTWELRQKFTQAFIEWNETKKEIERIERDAAAKEQRLDFLRFQKEEIEALELSHHENFDLETEVKKLKNASRLGHFVDSTEAALYSDDDSANARIHTVLQRAQELVSIDPSLSARLESLEQAKSLIEEAVYDLRKYEARIETDPKRLESLESRLSDFRKLQKKYGPTVKDILLTLENVRKELSSLESSDQTIETLKKKQIDLEKRLADWGDDLHKRRLQGAKLLSDSVNEELLDLNMKGTTFLVAVEKTALVSTGASDVEFMSKASLKDPARPLAKFASGGELSRILLSLKRVVGSSQQPRTYLFDEVDTGVSGPTAEKVGRKLKTIAHGQQVICVTHLPQVAAFGDAHYFIQKAPGKESVSMQIRELSRKDRVQEIARLISGEKISKTSLAHAQQLLNESLN